MSYGSCQVCNKPADIRVWGERVGVFCWEHYKLQKAVSGEPVDFIAHDLSITNEGTEEYGHSTN